MERPEDHVQVYFKERGGDCGKSDTAAVVVIPRRNGANEDIAQNLGKLIQDALDRGVAEGLWTQEESNDVHVPIGPNLDEDGNIIPDEAVLVAPYALVYLNGKRVSSDEMDRHPMADLEVEMEPRKDGSVQGPGYLLATLFVHLDPGTAALN